MNGIRKAKAQMELKWVWYVEKKKKQTRRVSSNRIGRKVRKRRVYPLYKQERRTGLLRLGEG